MTDNPTPNDIALLREALSKCADFIRMIKDDGVELFGTGVHTGLRKGTEADNAMDLWRFIAGSKTTAWPDAVAFAIDPFFTMWGGDEALTAAEAALAPTQHDDATAEGEACDCARQYDPEQFDHQASCVSQPAPSEQARAEGERITKLIDQIEAGDFEELDAAADKWAAAASVQRMANAMASVFERYASQDIMDRFREKLGALIHLAFVEGAAQGVLQLRATPKPSTEQARAEGYVLVPDELRALSERATPGPWAWEQCGEKEDVPVIGIAFPGDDPDCKAPYAGEFRDSDASRMTIAYDWQSCDGHSPSANAAFTVAAVNYVRAMLDAAATPSGADALGDRL